MIRIPSLRAAAALLGIGLLAAGAAAEDRPVMSPNGATLAVPVGPRRTEVLDTAGALVAALNFDADLSALAYSRDGRKLAACLLNGGVTVLDIASRAVKTAPGESGKRCLGAYWTADGGLIYVLAARDSQQPVESTVEVRSFDAAGTVQTLHTAKRPLPPASKGPTAGPPPGTTSEEAPKAATLPGTQPPAVQTAPPAPLSGRKGNRP